MSEAKCSQREPDCSARWLSRENDIAAASVEELKRSLLTSDGMGRNFKARCLDELLQRERMQNKQLNTKNSTDKEGKQ